MREDCEGGSDRWRYGAGADRKPLLEGRPLPRSQGDSRGHAPRSSRMGAARRRGCLGPVNKAHRHDPRVSLNGCRDGHDPADNSRSATAGR